MENNSLQFPAFLKKIRNERNLTYRETANLWGISYGYVCELENGNKRINMVIAGELIEKFGLNHEQMDELYQICAHDNPRVSRSVQYYSIEKKDLQFPAYIEKFKKEKNLTKKALAQRLGFATTYIWDLENGHRRITLSIATRFIKNFDLDENEVNEIYEIYNHDNGIIPADLVYFIVNNKLIDDIRTIKEYDSKGQTIKKLAESYEKKR